MPRIYDSASNPLDFHKRHMPTEAVAKRKYGNEAITGEGPDGRGNCFGYDADHPAYEDEGYECESCGGILTAGDD